MRAALLLANALDRSQNAGKVIVSPDRSGIFSGVGEGVSVAVEAAVAVWEAAAAMVLSGLFVLIDGGARLGLQADSNKLQTNPTRIICFCK